MKTGTNISSTGARAQESLQTARQATSSRTPHISTADLSFRLLFPEIRQNVARAGSFDNIGSGTVNRQPVDKARQQKQRPRDEDLIAQPMAPAATRNDEPARKRETDAAAHATKRAVGPKAPERPQAVQHEPTREAPPANAAEAASRNTETGTPAVTADSASDPGVTTTQTAGATAPASASAGGLPPSSERPATPAAQPAQAAQATPALQAASPAQPQGAVAQAAGTSVQQLATGIQAADAAPLQPVTDAEAMQLAQEAGLVQNTAPNAAAGVAGTPPASAVQGTMPDTASMPGEAPADDMLMAEGTLLPQAVAETATDAGAQDEPSAQRRPQGQRDPALALPQAAELRANTAARIDGTNATAVTQDMTAGSTSRDTGQNTGTMPVAAARSEGTGFSLGLGVAATPGSHSPVRADGSPLLASRIDSPVNSSEFREMFARQVAGLVVQGQDRAEIRLTPAELGPIRIRLTVSAEDAQLDISAAHASTRAAIEASMPTLRQMLADQGMRLADYRMDQGNTPGFLSQQRQNDQGQHAGMQQSMNTFGQGNGTGGEGRQGQDYGSRGRDGSATETGSVAAPEGANGTRIGRRTTVEGNIDTFA